MHQAPVRNGVGKGATDPLDGQRRISRARELSDYSNNERAVQTQEGGDGLAGNSVVDVSRDG